MEIDKDDPFLDKADEWKNKSSFGSISISIYQKPDSLKRENIIKKEINITTHGLSKEEFEECKSEIMHLPQNIENSQDYSVFSSFIAKLIFEQSKARTSYRNKH